MDAFELDRLGTYHMLRRFDSIFGSSTPYGVDIERGLMHVSKVTKPAWFTPFFDAYGFYLTTGLNGVPSPKVICRCSVPVDPLSLCFSPCMRCLQ